MRVLVTGAAGNIGSVLCPDPEAVHAAFAGADRDGGLDAVVHLAGIPTEAPLPDILDSHVRSTGVLLDEMVEHSVPRVVFASSNHAVGFTPRSELLRAEAPARPDTLYGVGKVAAEALLRLYADRHGLSAIAIRIGSFLPRPETRRHLSTWLSHDDSLRMVDACLSAPDPGFAVLYGVSANTRGWWDLEPGRRLGYHPRDDAERFAREIEATPASEQDDADAAHVGGGFALPGYTRPAVDGPHQRPTSD